MNNDNNNNDNDNDDDKMIDKQEFLPMCRYVVKGRKLSAIYQQNTRNQLKSN